MLVSKLLAWISFFNRSRSSRLIICPLREFKNRVQRVDVYNVSMALYNRFSYSYSVRTLVAPVSDKLTARHLSFFLGRFCSGS